MIYAKSIERHGFMAAITFCQPCLPRQKFTLPRARCLTIPAPRALPISNESSWKRKIEPFFSTERSKRIFFFSQKRILRWMFSSSKDRKCQAKQYYIMNFTKVSRACDSKTRSLMIFLTSEISFIETMQILCTNNGRVVKTCSKMRWTKSTTW